MLGVAPDRGGLLPESDVLRLHQLGEAIHGFESGNPSLQHLPRVPEAAAAFDGKVDTFWSAPGGSQHATLEMWLENPVKVDRVTTMEWLNDG